MNDMNDSRLPLARKSGLVVQESADELLVYDLETDRAHSLNETAASIWRSCDGSMSAREIAELPGNENLSEEIVWLAIDQLSEKDLLDSKVETKYTGQSRREAIRKIGLATFAALPVIASLAAPSSVLASASCACAVPGDCAPLTSCPSTSICNGAGVCAP